MVVEISDWNDLDNVRNDLTGDYVLVNDLDSDTAGYTGIGDDFEPIGFISGESYTSEFAGSFDGDGFQISDLVIEYDDESDIGFFASTDTGALIENVSVGGSVTVTTGGENHGGLVGIHETGTIQNCVSHVDVTALDGNRAGGLIGRNEDGTVTESYATGSVDGYSSVGGLVGVNNETITDSYATGSVEADDRVAGLVGDNLGTVQTSYAVGLVTGNEDVGGLCSDPFDLGTVTDSYWDTEATGQDTSTGGTGLTTSEMQGSEAETNMDGFDFTFTWETISNDYPTLLDPAFFDVSIDSTNSPVEGGDELNVDYTVTNTSEQNDSQSITLDLSGIGQVDLETQSLLGGGSTSSTLSYNTTSDDGGDRTATVASDSDTDSIGVTIIVFDLTVETNPATDISEFSATLNGELVELDDEADDADVFFEFGENVTDSQTAIQTLTEPATFDELVDELEPNTTFEFRAIAEAQNADNETFIDEGDILTFDTDIVTLDGTISLDEAGVENADVLVHNFTQNVFEGRLSTDIDGNYAVDLPDVDRLDTIAVAVDFDDGTERYGRLVTTVLE